MENPGLEKFKERIRNEAELFYTKSRSQKGFEDGEREALQWSYEFFQKYEKVFGDKQDVRNFTDQDIAELYSLSKSRQNVRRIRISRIETGQGIDGFYEIIEEQNVDPLKDTSEEERSEYLKGWLKGIHRVWVIALTATR